jgi:glycosidase
LYRKLIHLRKDNPALLIGTYQAVDEEQNDYLAFLRKSDDQTCLVLLNFSEHTATVEYSIIGGPLYSSQGRGWEINTAGLSLAPFEILILEVINPISR